MQNIFSTINIWFIVMTKSLSSIIVTVSIAIMIAMFFCYLWGIRYYNKTEKEVDKLLGELKEIEKEGKTRKLELINYKEIKGEVKAFNETLMLKGEKHYSTIGVERYFNIITLLEEKLNMRIINYIPQIFPGLGILGTFLGLTLGLRVVNTSGSSKEILSSIEPLLGNISLAFITSIAGIGFSIVATFRLNWFLGGAEKKILKLEDTARRIFPLYTKTLQGEELLKEIKEIKTTTNGLATDISNKLGEHISTQVGEKIDTLVSGSNEIMKDLTYNIGDKIERITEVLSSNFGDSLTGALDKIFTEDLVGNFKQIGVDMVRLSSENITNIKDFKETMDSVILDLNDIKDNYEDINNKTSKTNEEVSSSLNSLTETIVERTIAVDENLERTVGIFNSAAIQIEVLEKSLSKSLKETAITVEKLSDYTNINKEASESINRFIDSEEKILELWNGYDEKFTNLNVLLVEGSKGFEESLNTSISSYKNQLNGIRDEFSTMMTTLNQKYSDYTNKNTIDLFKEYDHQLATAINKFGGLMKNLGDEVEGLQIMIENQNEKIGEAIEIINPVKRVEIEKNIYTKFSMEEK